jgi:hypothetical protein
MNDVARARDNGIALIEAAHYFYAIAIIAANNYILQVQVAVRSYQSDLRAIARRDERFTRNEQRRMCARAA